MEGLSIQQVIDKLTEIKNEHGEIELVVEICQCGNYWYEPLRELRITDKNYYENDPNEKTKIVLFSD